MSASRIHPAVLLHRFWNSLMWRSGAGPEGPADLETLESRLLLDVAPVAVDDPNVATTEDLAVTVDVLANDTDGDPMTELSILSVANGQYGTVTIDGTNVVYRPLADFHGSDSFTYVATDGVYASNTATVTVTVASVEDAPAAGADSYTVPAGLTLSVASAARGLLASDYDGDGDSLTARLAEGGEPTHGTLTMLGADGTFEYVPEPGFAGIDVFRYVVSDRPGSDSNVAAVSIEVRAPGDNAAPQAPPREFHILYGQDLQVGLDQGLITPGADSDGDLLEASLSTAPPAPGVVTVSPDGTFHFALSQALQESDFVTGDVAAFTFGYTLSDGLLGSTADVAVYVHREGPSASGRFYLAAHDRPLVVPAEHGLLVGATLGTGTALRVVEVSPGSQAGQVTVLDDLTGAFTYQPAAGFVGVDSFTFRLSNGVKTSAAATVRVEVTNAAPIPMEDHYRLTRTGPGDVLTIAVAEGLLANDVDADGDTLQVAAVEPGAGQVSVEPDGSLVYTPPAGRPGNDTFRYRVSDGLTTSDWVPVTIEAAYAPPAAQDDSYSLVHDRLLTVDQAAQGLLANDTNLGADPSITICGLPAHGTLTLLATPGTFTYQPHAGFVGADTFVYWVGDDLGASNVAMATLWVTNAAPTAGTLSFAVDEDAVLSGAPGALLAGAADADEDPLTTSLYSPPAHGSVTVNADGSFVYTPAAGFSGADAFAYRVGDGLSWTTGFATVDVAPVNDPPPTPAPVYTAHGGGGPGLNVPAPGVLAGIADPDGDALTVTLIGSPEFGSLVLQADGAFTYYPGSVWGVQDQFTFTVSDGTAGVVGTATIELTNAAPVAANVTYYVPSGTSLSIGPTAGMAMCSQDGDGDSLSVTGFTAPQAVAYGGSGSVASTGAVSYDPGTFVGTDSMTYTISDGRQTAQGTITLIVDAYDIIAYPNAYRMAHDQTLTVPADRGVLYNDWETGSSTCLETALVDQPAAGTLNLAIDGGFTFTPPAGTTGMFTFTYVAHAEGSLVSDPVTVTIEVTNQPPVAQDDHYRLLHDTGLLVIPVDHGVRVNDYDLDEADEPLLTVELVDGTQHGQVVLHADGSFEYVPDAHYVGSDAFTYRLQDPAGGAGLATVSLDVTNIGPVAVEHEFTTHQGTALAGQVLTGCYDMDRDALTARLVNPAGQGTASVGANGSFTYVPAPGYVGPDSFGYVVSDGVADSTVAIVTLEVRNTGAWAAPDHFRGPHGQALTGNLLANDMDVDGDALSVQVYSTLMPADGVELVWQPDGSFTLTPAPGVVGTFELSYAVFDGAQWTAPVPFTVELLDTAPVGLDDHFVTVHDTALVLDVLANDADADAGDTLSLLSFTPAVGTLSPQGDGRLLYTPPAGFAGQDGFTYVLTDGAIVAGPVRVVIEVTNAPPHAVNDYFQTPTGQALSGSVAGNDLNDDGDSLTLTLVTPPAYGQLTFNANGAFTYTPQASFTGVDMFVYSVTDGVETHAAQANIAVLPALLQAVNDAFDVPAGACFAGDLRANDLAPAAPAIVAELVSYTGAGQMIVCPDGTFDYVPPPGWLGQEQFTYRLGWGTLVSTAQVLLHVYAPLPQANPRSVQGQEDAELVIDLTNVLDPGCVVDPDSLSAPWHGQAAWLSDTEILYTPRADFFGDDSFKYAVLDAWGQRSTRAAITVTVNAVDDPTVALSDVAETIEDYSVLIPVLANDVDADGSPAGVLTISSPAAHGSATVIGTSIRYEPAPNYTGSDNFQYTVTDGALPGSSAGVTVIIGAVNDPPSGPGQPVEFSLDEDGQFFTDPTIGGLFSDVESGTRPRHLEITGGPSHGQARVFASEGEFSLGYWPEADFHGTDSIHYTAYDSDWVSVSGSIQLTVNPMPDAPVVRNEHQPLPAGNFTLSVAELLANDYDPDGGSLSIVDVCVGEGEAWLEGDTIHVVPMGSLSGLVYWVTDSQGASAIGEVTFWSISEPPPPYYTLAPGESVSDAPSQLLVTNYGVEREGQLVGTVQVSFSGRDISLIGQGDAWYSLHVSTGASCQQPYTVTWSGQATGRLALSTDDWGTVAAAEVAGDLVLSAGRIDACAGHDVNVATDGNLGSVTATGSILSLNIGGDLTGAVVAAGDVCLVSIGGDLSGQVAANGGDINGIGVVGRINAGASIYALGHIPQIKADGNARGTVWAGGTIGRVESTYGTVGGTIHADGAVGAGLVVWAMLDVQADITAVGELAWVRAGRDITGTVESIGDDIQSVWAARTITGAIAAGQDIDEVWAGLDVTGASITAGGMVGQVWIGRALTSAVHAAAGIQTVTVGLITGLDTLTGHVGAVTIETSAGNIDAIAVRAPLRPAGQRIGLIDGATIRAHCGDIYLIEAAGSVVADIWAGAWVGHVIAGEYIGHPLACGQIRGGAGVGEVVTGPAGNLLAPVQADTGSVDSVQVGLNIDGEIRAITGSIGTVVAGGDILKPLTAGTTIGEVSAGGTIVEAVTAPAGLEAIQAGADILGDLTVVAGSIGSITVGAAGQGNLAGAVIAGLDIGPVRVLASADLDEGDIPLAGMAPVYHVWHLVRSALPPVPQLEPMEPPPAAPSAGYVIGSITAGGAIVSVTALGQIQGNISAGGNIGWLWALGEIIGDVQAGAGDLTVNTWGSASGAIAAEADITVNCYGNLSSSIVAGGKLSASSWGGIGGALESHGDLTIWSAGDVSSPQLTSLAGGVNLAAYGTLSAPVQSATAAKLFCPTVRGTAVYSGDSAVVMAWTLEDVVAAVAAGTVNVVCFGPANVQARSDTGGVQVYATEFGGEISAHGAVLLDVLGAIHANTVVNAHGNNVTVHGQDVDGQYSGQFVSVTALGTMSGFVNAAGGADVSAAGDVTGQVRAGAAADVFANGRVEGLVLGATDVTVVAWGDVAGAVRSSDGDVVVRTFGAVVGPIQAAQTADVTAWGDTACNIQGHTVYVFAGGTAAGNVGAATDATVEALADVTATVAADAALASVTAYGNISGAVTGAGAIVSAGQSVTGDVTSTAGEARVDAGGSISGTVSAPGAVIAVAGDFDAATLRSTAGEVAATARGLAGLTIEAATGATLLAGGDATASVTLTPGEPGRRVTLTTLQALSATVNAEGAVLDTRAGQTANVTAGGAGGPLESATVQAEGAVTVDLVANSTAMVISWHTVSGTVATTAPGSLLSLFGAQGVSVTASAADDLAATSLMDLTGSYAAGVHENATSGTATLEAKGRISATVTARGAIDAQAGQDIAGSLACGADVSAQAGTGIVADVSTDAGATLVSLDGPVNGTIQAGQDVWVLSAQHVAGSVLAGGKLDITCLGDLSAESTSGADASLSVAGAVAGPVDAAGFLSLSAGSLSATVRAGLDAVLRIGGQVDASATITVDGAVQASVLGSLGGQVSAGSGAVICAGQNVAGVQALTGSVSVIAGGDATGPIVAAQLAGVEVVGSVLGSVQAGTYAMVSAGLAIVGSITADQDADVTAGAVIVGPITATNGAVRITGGGELVGAVTAGAAVSVAVIGGVWGPVTGGPGSNVQVQAGGNLYSTITSSAGAQVSADTMSMANINAGGQASVRCTGVTVVNVQAAGAISVLALNPVTVNLTGQSGVSVLTSSALTVQHLWAGGAADVFASATLTATGGIQAVGNVSIVALTAALGWATSDAGDVSLTVASSTTMTLTAHGTASLSALGSAGGSLSAGGQAHAVVAGTMTDLSVSGDAGVQLTALGGGAASVASSAGPVIVRLYAPTTLTSLSAGQDITVLACADVTLTASTPAGADIRAAGDIAGQLLAAQAVSVISLGRMTATVRGHDVRIVGIEEVDAWLTAYGDLSVTSYGDVNAEPMFHANGTASIWARGNITGYVEATGWINEVISFGTINAYLNSLDEGIGTVISWGDLAGYYRAVGTVGQLHAGGDITAVSLGCAGVLSFIEHDLTLRGPLPTLPRVSAAPVRAELRGVLRAVWQDLSLASGIHVVQAVQTSAQQEWMTTCRLRAANLQAQVLAEAQALVAWSVSSDGAELAAQADQAARALDAIAGWLGARLDGLSAEAEILHAQDRSALDEGRRLLVCLSADAQAARDAAMTKAAVLTSCTLSALTAQRALLEQARLERADAWAIHARQRADLLVDVQGWDAAHTGPWGLSGQEIRQAVWGGIVEGGWAGVVNVADKLTLTLVPSLHRYRNQVWQDVYLAGTAWETASDAAAWTGTACLYTAVGLKVYSLPRMWISVGRGLRPFYFHVKYGVGRMAEHASGKLLEMTVETTTLKQAWFILRLPVPYAGFVLYDLGGNEGPVAWTCLTAALHAFARGWGWPW